MGPVASTAVFLMTRVRISCRQSVQNYNARNTTHHSLIPPSAPATAAPATAAQGAVAQGAAGSKRCSSHRHHSNTNSNTNSNKKLTSSRLHKLQYPQQQTRCEPAAPHKNTNMPQRNIKRQQMSSTASVTEAAVLHPHLPPPPPPPPPHLPHRPLLPRRLHPLLLLQCLPHYAVHGRVQSRTRESRAQRVWTGRVAVVMGEAM